MSKSMIPVSAVSRRSVLALPILLLPPDALARAAPLPARSALLVDASAGRVLFADHAGIVRPPASLAKLMTLYLTFDALDAGALSLESGIVFSRYASGQRPSSLAIPPGGRLSVDDAIKAIVVHSANDVAVALAERIAGSELKFAALMTDKAHALGMRHTRFANASGLSNPGNLTTAQDIAIVSMAMLRHHRRYYPYFATRTFTWRGKTLSNHNHLLGRVEGVDGMKTGYTVDAGFNLVASAARGARRVIAIVMGAASLAERDSLATRLIDRGLV